MKKEVKELEQQQPVEKVDPDHFLLFSEPVTKLSTDYSSKILVPAGFEKWAYSLFQLKPDIEELQMLIRNEYIDIAETLQAMQVPFMFIGAHLNHLDPQLLTKLDEMKIRGSRFFSEMPSHVTVFPRDFQTEIGDKILINPTARLEPVGEKSIVSKLGEGGCLLTLGNKCVMPTPASNNSKFQREIKTITEGFNVAFLPPPVGLQISASGEKKRFKSDHLDRVATFIKGKDQRDHLLVDQNYLDDFTISTGKHRPKIEDACRKLDVELVSVGSHDDETLYALNLVQFADGSILHTAGHPTLTTILGKIVGSENVYSTKRPVLIYPLVGRGGIRCMMLFINKKLLRNIKDERT